MKQFLLYDKDITFSDAECRYRDIDHRYSERGKQTGNKFLLFYKETDKSDPEIFLENFTKTCGELISENVDLLHQDLVNTQIYNYSRDRLIEQYSEIIFGHWLQDVQLLNQRFQEIIDEGNDEIQDREIRKNSRRQWVGGGFGVGGAIKGAATAGVFNGISGIGHSTLNIIGNTVTRSKVRGELNRLINKIEYYEGISEVLCLTIKEFENIYVDIILKETEIEIEQYFEQDMLEQNGMLDSLKYITNDREIKDILIKCIQIYPYNHEIYKFAVDKYGDADCAIEKISDFFNVSIRYYKEEIVRKNVGEVNYENEESMLRAKKELQYMEKKLGVKMPELTQQLNIGLQKYDIKMRTVYDISSAYEKGEKKAADIVVGPSWVCSTREEAAENKRQVEKIKEIYNKIDFSNEASIENGQTQILEIAINYDLGNQILAELKDRLEEIDLEARTVLGVVYSTRIEAVAEQAKVVNGKKYESEATARYVTEELQKVEQLKKSCFYSEGIINKISTLKELYQLRLKTDQGKNEILNTEKEIIREYQELKISSGNIGKSIFSFIISVIISIVVAIFAIPFGLSAGIVGIIITILSVIGVISYNVDKFNEIKENIIAKTTLIKLDGLISIRENKVYFYTNGDK